MDTRYDDAGGRPLVAVVGGDTLLAREVRSLLEAARPAPRLKLISATAGVVEPSSGEDAEEEAAALLPLSLESLEGARVAILAGSPSSSRRALKLRREGLTLIDLTGALEDQPLARLRGPAAEAGPAEIGSAGSAGIQVIAHPAALVLAKLLVTVSRCSPVRVSLAHIFEPASERGLKGIEELQKQTVALLAFKKLPKDVFDAQLAFNVLARYGEEALEPLEGVEQRAERHLASLLAAWPGVAMPSLRMIQVPVFHGHSFSVWVEFQTNPGVRVLADELERGGFDVRPDDPPTNAGSTGESGIAVGAMNPDRNNSRAFWFWLAADNLRLTAENAVAVAQEML